MARTPSASVMPGGAGFFSQKVWAMSRPERLALVDHDDQTVPVVAQCRLLKVARSTLLLPAGAGQHGRSGGDAPDGRAVSGFTFLWIASDGGGVAPRGLDGEPQAGQTADAGHGAGGDLPEAEHQLEASR